MTQTPFCRSGLLPTLLLAFCSSGWAGEHRGEASEHDFLDELPVVLTASRLVQPLADAPGAVTLIDREMIKASGAREIADLFRLVPGFNVSFANGGNPVVNYHGLTGQTNPGMQVLVDGRSYYSSYFLGGVNWNMPPIALEDIDRIEIVRGSNSAAYGANAFLGVANIITRHPSETHGASLSASLGTQGIRDNSARFGGGGDGLDYRFTIGRREDSGFSDVYDDRRVSYLNFRGDLQLDDRNHFQAQFGASESSTGAGFTLDPFNPPRTQLASHWFGQLQWRHVLGPDEELSLTGYHVRDGGVDNYTMIQIPADLGRRTERTNIELQHIFRPRPDLRVVWGLEHRDDQVHSRQIFNTDAWQQSRLSRLFGNLEWRTAPWLLINAGAMVENYSLTGTDVAPRLMLNFQPSPNHTIRAGVSRAMRTPSLMEKGANVVFPPIPYPTHLGNSSLKPERIASREISYLGEFRPYGLTLDARLYSERVRDLISSELLTPTSSTRGFLNAYGANLRGLEYEFRWRPGTGRMVSLSQSYMHIDGVEPLNSGDRSAEELMQSAPRLRTTLFAMGRLGNDWQASIAHHWVGAMVWTGDGDPVGKYRRLDLRLAKTFIAGGRRVEAAITSQNLFDRYAEFRGAFTQTMPIYYFTRRTFATLSLEF